MFNLAPVIPSRSDLDWCWYLRRHGYAGDALERVLHDIGVMEPNGWAHWHPSTLTDTGAPVAVEFSADDKALALTTEVDNPAVAPATRLAKAYKIIADLGGTGPSIQLREVISAAQGLSALEYGARLRLRHDGKKLGITLLAEIPASASDLSPLMSETPFSLILQDYDPSARATMLAYDTLTQQVTIHCEADNVQRTILPALCMPAQVSPDVLSMSIDGMISCPPQIAFPTRTLGFSYTMGSAGTLPILSLSFSSKELFKDDTTIEKRVRTCGGNKLPSYKALLEHLPTAAVGKTHHGNFQMKARQNAAPVLSISVAAPWHSYE
ncbi:hypothetical protein [Yoonia maritima]|uniref:hypothetical protein n=1 Tax=Yoonia maritima TaxID=1435347 RepID=UPI000D0F651C|nr:hypothetical protein [Yoonia maritima]